GEDRALTRAELDKLVLYAGARSTPIELDEAMACIGDGAGLAADDSAFVTADANPAAIDRALARELADGATPIGVLRGAIRHFTRLHLVAGLVAGGTPAAQAITALRPPPFGRARDRFLVQATRWSLPELAAALDRLLAAELACKRGGAPAEAICWRT